MRKFSIFLLLVTSYLLLVTTIHAINQIPPGQQPPTGDGIPQIGVNIGSKFGFGNIRSLGEGTGRLVTPIFSLAAFLVILYFLLGAFRYLKAGSNKEEVQAGKDMITHAIIGFILLMFTFFILQFIINFLFKKEFPIIGS